MKKGLFNQTKQRFSIRKYSVGVASVLIASVLFMGGQGVAADDSVQADAISQVQVANSDNASDEHQVVTSDSQEEKIGEDTSKLSQENDTKESSLGDTQNQVAANDEQVTDQKASEEKQNEESAATNEATPESTEPTETVTIDATALAKETQENQKSFVKESKVTVKTQKNLPSQGYYTYTQKTEVKNEAKASAPVAFYANAGDRVFYDQVLTQDGYQWISYNSYSGQRRYAAIAKLTPEVVQKLSGSINFQNVTSQGFEVLVTNVSDSKGIAAVKVPIWTEKNDQDDIIWYDAIRQSNGDYKVFVNTSDHKGETGTYIVHLYYQETDGHMQGVEGKQVTVPEKTTGVQNIPSQGSYIFQERVEVKNEPKMSAPTEFTFEKGSKLDLYDQVLEADNHQWISYVSYGGVRRYIPIATLKNQKPTGDVAVKNYSTGDFDVIISNISDAKGVSAVKVPIWTVKNDQDDIIWYDGIKQNDGTYKVNVKLSDHNYERGDYNIHLYYVESDGHLQAVLGTKTTVPEGTLSGDLQIVNQSAAGFDVLVTNVSNPGQLESVKVPVWSTQGGQDDIIWYTAAKQADGSYKTRVNVSDHKNNYGEYNIHLYYEQADGSLKGVGGTKATLQTPQTPAMPQSGTYVLTSSKEVKSQPRVSAPTEFKLDAGYQVHYDKALYADGHQWISYVSYSGARRYVLID
ncbi:signal peptide-containing protein, YSIRK family [Streptococcus equinus]|uniref:Signal peptide-containing protein, YSIRK family n=1 Tax=Streptococcus equinus TaxID=1335 RepID=A0A1H0LUC0_STREI|nr:GBS Bsp-like repeat-containing protein [Streptococcus equinus]SDO71651.1 signal peptide-containing protein, YSIRK family [Streptococcus equinus]